MGKFAGFTQSTLSRPQRSDFDLSHLVRSSTRMGRLTPVFVQEAVPGDTFSASSEILLRLAPLLAPIYDSMMLFVHFFFVPNRLLWNEWETFITGGRLGAEADPSLSPIPPYMASLGFIMSTYAGDYTKRSTLWDYMGCPLVGDIDPSITPYNGVKIDMLPFMAYQKIWMDFYRDRNFTADDYFDNGLADGQSFPFGSGVMSDENVTKMLSIRTRHYQADYFTSALPFTQRGSEVLMPLAGTGSVTYLDQARFSYGGAPGSGFYYQVDGVQVPQSQALWTSASPGFILKGNTSSSTDGPAIYADLADVSAVTINSLREAVQVQRLYERDARGGTRYTEIIRSHFGVISPDARLQRPEYLGGGSTPVIVSPVAQTSSTDGTSPQGNLAALGTCALHGHGFTKSFTEHCILIGLVNVRADLNYQQGINRMWSRLTRFDFYWPALSHLGEQAVLNKEIFAQGEITPK